MAGEKTTAQLRAMLHRRALAADPEHARKRRAEGVRERRVIVEPAADGTARLTALGLAPQRAQAVFERVTAIAKARKLSGAAATMDQLRADAVLDLLEGTAIGVRPGPRRGVVELIVGLDTLAGLTDHPGDLHGFGPVAADIARQCAAANLGAQWRFSVIDPQTGELLLHNITRARPHPPAPGADPTVAPRPAPHPASPHPNQHGQASRRRATHARPGAAGPKATRPNTAEQSPAGPGAAGPNTAGPSTAGPTHSRAEHSRAEHSRAEHSRAKDNRARGAGRAQPGQGNGPGQPGQGQPGRTQPGQGQPGGHSRARANQAEHSRAEHSRAKPSRAKPIRAKRNRAEHSRAKDNRAEPSLARGNRAERNRASPRKAVPIQASPRRPSRDRARPRQVSLHRAGRDRVSEE